MKINDFLRMKITSDNKQFDAIKNIRFYDDKNSLLVGKGTTSVQAFCEQFFDYVYRNFSSARGAEKLVKSNRKKYTKFSGSESMLLVQRILDEICDEYAITNYSITCEVENGNAKKAATSQTGNEAQKKPSSQTGAGTLSASSTQADSTEAKTGVSTPASGSETTKLKTLSSQLERIQSSDSKVQNKQQEKPQQLQSQAPQQPQKIQQQEYAGLEESYIHPVIDENASRKAEPVNDPDKAYANTPVKNQNVQTEDRQQEPKKEILYNAMGQIITDLDEPEKDSAASQSTAEDKSLGSQKNVSSPNTGAKNSVPEKPAVQKAPAQNVANQNTYVQNTGSMPQSRKDKKHGKKQQNIQDPRMKPGKGMKPFKPNENFKAATKFQKADNNSKQSKLNIDEIPCIAIKEEEIIPTMDEVPFIGIPEESEIPSLASVPFVGIEENVGGKDISEIKYIGVEEGESGKDIPDVPYLGYEPGEADMPIPDVPFIVSGDYYSPDDASEEQLARSAAYEAAAKEESVTLQERIAEHEIQQAAQIEESVHTENYQGMREEPEETVDKQSAEESVDVQSAEESVDVQSAEETVDIQSAEKTVDIQSAEEVLDLQSVGETDNIQSVEENVYIQSTEELGNMRSAEKTDDNAGDAESNILDSRKIDPIKLNVEAENHAVDSRSVIKETEPQKQTVAAQLNNMPSPRKESPKPIVERDIRKIISLALLKYKQVVFTGPSATGKTYQVRKYARKNSKGYDGYKFVQFHPEFEYSDFIEGLRPVNILNTANPTNVRMDGVFKAFCRRIVEDNLEHAVSGFSSLYAEKKQKVVQELFEKIRDKKEALEDGSETQDFARDSQEYVFEHGVREYYFVIDEINRANAASVFGDVLFALDEDYRGIENRFDTRLGNLKTYHIIQAEDIGKANYSTSHIGFAEQMKFDCFEKGFFIPHNLHIIATMNELSGSASDMDFSFRQKFRWVKINPSEIMESSLREILKDMDIDWIDQFAKNLNLVNNLISEGFSSDYCLGPAFFRRLNAYPESIDEVFENDVEPVLKEYLKDKPDDISEMFIAQCRKALKMGI